MMKKAPGITIKNALFIAQPPEHVWDFTQNYDNRSRWDASVQWAKTLQTEPNRVVRLRMAGGTEVTFVYKLDDRPRKTTLLGTDIHSPLVGQCGGSWSYEAVEGGTRWEQTNTIVLKNIFALRIFRPFLRWLFEQQTRRAMQKAKQLLEEE